MSSRVTRINPIARTMLQQRRRQQFVPDKTKYDRKKDKQDADKYQQNAYKKGEQEGT